MADLTLKQWHEQQFLPWKQAVAKVMEKRQEEREMFQQHVGQLQSILALLLEGRNRQAVLAWNTLHLKPTLADIRLGSDSETVTLMPLSGEPLQMGLDEIIADLQRMLDERGNSLK
ncbi:MAG TPA: hypothetical protein VHP58_00560 [Alphaproteobacteria bacterium]|nr:hypothetical protein [Alphaproteobacteria bacterium]